MNDKLVRKDARMPGVVRVRLQSIYVILWFDMKQN